MLGLDRELLKLVLPVGRRLAVLQSCLRPCKLFHLEPCTFLAVTHRRSCVSQCSPCLALVCPSSIGSLHLGRASVTQPFQAALQVIQGTLKSPVLERGRCKCSLGEPQGVLRVAQNLTV